MPKMPLVWAAIYTTLLLGSFVNPVLGTLGYIFEYYLRPSTSWWGTSLPDLRWNFMMSTVLTFTFLVRRSSLPDIGPAPRGPARHLLALLLVMILVSPTVAVNQNLSWAATVDYSKLILFHGLVVGTVRSELAFDAVAAMHMAGAGWWGWEAYRHPKRTAGRLQNVGSGDTRGDNGTAAHLLVVIPFMVIYSLIHWDKRLRALAIVVAPFVLNTFILCNSRGAMLGLIAMAVAAVWVTRSGHRIRLVVAAVAFGAALVALADPQFKQRQQATSDYENDGSATGRLIAWKGSLSLIKDYPFGAGGQGFWELSPIYAPELVERSGVKRDSHNTFVLVASEWGVLGLALFVGYYWSCFRLLADVRRRAINNMWYYRSVAIELSMIGLLVAGSFTDRLYAEAPYWMGALAVALQRIHSYQLKQAAAGTATAQPIDVESEPRVARAG